MALAHPVAIVVPTSESFVACSKEKMLHKLHSLRQFQASRHATVDGLSLCPSACWQPGSLSVGKNEAKQSKKKRGQQKLSASNSTAPTGGSLRLRLRLGLRLLLRLLLLPRLPLLLLGIFCLWLCVLGRK